MEQCDFKTGVPPRKPKPWDAVPASSSPIWPTWNHCFSQIAEGSANREQGEAGLGCSASKAIAPLPMILSGLGGA